MPNEQNLENAKKQSDQSGHIVSVRTRKQIADKFSLMESYAKRIARTAT